MNKWIAAWQKKTTFQKVMTVIGLAASTLTILFALLYVLDLFEGGLFVMMALMCVSMLSQGGLYWQKDKPMAILSIVVGLFMCGVTAYILLWRFAG